MKSLGIIGFGIMGEAIVQGVLKINPSLSLNVIEKSEARLKIAQVNYRATDFNSDLKGFFAKSDYVLLAIKPQDLENLLKSIATYATDARIITILAGKKLDSYLKHCPKAQIARLMPNLAAAVGKSVTGIAYSQSADEEFKLEVKSLTEAIGLALEIPEQLMSAIVGISGSGIAFVFEFIHAMAMAGTQAGIAYAKSLELSLSVIDGAVSSLRASNVHPIEMVSRVCSPAGTTVAGIEQLEHAGFRAGLMNAVKAASQRSSELET